MFATTIKKQRSGLAFDVRVRVRPDDFPSEESAFRTMCGIVRRFLNPDTREKVLGAITLPNGWTVEYRFDGAEIIRDLVRYQSADEIKSTLLMLAGMEEEPSEPGTSELSRREVNRRDHARRTIAKAMGFRGIKDWQANGSPMPAEGSDAWKRCGRNPARTIALADIPSPGTGGIPALTTSIVRPYTTKVPRYVGGHRND